MATDTPTGGLYVAVAFEQDLSRIFDAEQIGLVIERS